MEKHPEIGCKRNYIRRKKYFHDCEIQIKAMLDFVTLVKGFPINSVESEKQSFLYAQQIEAVCWSPRSQISAENYQKLMQSKTREFINLILNKNFPFLDINQLLKMISSFKIENNTQATIQINQDLLNSIKAKNNSSQSSMKSIENSSVDNSNNLQNKVKSKTPMPIINEKSNIPSFSNNKIIEPSIIRDNSNIQSESQKDDSNINIQAQHDFPISDNPIGILDSCEVALTDSCFNSTEIGNCVNYERNEFEPICVENNELTGGMNPLQSFLPIDVTDISNIESFTNSFIM